MQRFQFSLQRALEWRTSQLDLEQARLTRLNQEKSRIVELSARFAQSRRDAAQVADQATGPVTGAELARVASYRDGLAARIERLAVQIKEFDTRIATQLKRVVEADRNKQLLEQLKETKLEEWKYEMNRELESTAGELYLARQSRRSR